MDNFDLDHYLENDAKDVFWALPIGLVIENPNEYFFEAKKALLDGDSLGKAAGEPMAP